jgi:glucokinase
MNERTGLRLVADIGGTNARFGCVDASGEIRDVVKIAVRDHARFEDALDAAIERFGAPRFREALVAVAGPVRHGMAALTNADWLISEDALATWLGTGAVRLVNDFEAQALAIPHLGGDDLRTLGEALPPCDPRLPRVALGPGTGLGVSLWVPRDGGYRSVATEGGHVSLACDDARLRARLQAAVGDRPLEAEDVLCGAGIGRLHEAMHGTRAEPSAVTSAGARGDAAAIATLERFADLLARFAAESVLATGAFGGVYIGGGLIEAGHIPLAGERMRKVFVGAGRMAHLLEKVPLFAVRRVDTALLGLARAPISD